jgi:membrane-bound lytic murein transglycosylase B
MATLPSRDELRAYARQVAQKNGLDPEMFVAQIQQESGFNPNTRPSKSGAQGIAQFMPRTARALGVDTKDPYSSLDGAAKYMAQLKQRFGTEELARQAYNWGETNLQAFIDGKKRAMPKETIEYNTRIAALAGKSAPSQTDAPRAAPAPAGAAGAPGGRAMAAANDQQLLATAFQEMNDGLPAGSMLAQAAPQAMPEATPSWLKALESMGTPSAPTRLAARGMDDEWANLDAIRDKAAADQERLMARMFADMNPDEQGNDTSNLPPAVDRYLERTLAA